MSNLVEKIELLIASSCEVEGLLQKPDIALIPFMGKRDSFYVLIHLVFVSAESYQIAMNACIEVLRFILRSGLVADLPGIEIVPCMPKNDRIQRLFRLSVRTEAYPDALTLSRSDLLVDVPLEGVTCGWYVAKPVGPKSGDGRYVD